MMMDMQPLYGSLSEREYKLFSDYIADKCGICIPPEKAYLIETRLARIVAESGVDTPGELYSRLVTGKAPDAPQKIINAITTNETLWFRDGEPWLFMEREILPKLCEGLSSGAIGRARVWSAAASTGQEVYSTVMCVDDYLTKNPACGAKLSDFEFVATDISDKALEIARMGRYDKISVKRGLADHYRDRYFHNRGSAWEIDQRIRDAVTFSEFNLMDDPLRYGRFDVIFLRYVLIYFSDELKARIIGRMRSALAEGGILFTGNYALFDMFKDGFEAIHSGNMTCYKKNNKLVVMV
jgi:chemotaxis protein methyltransferase CheR